jgi:hypothetical protein
MTVLSWRRHPCVDSLSTEDKGIIGRIAADDAHLHAGLSGKIFPLAVAARRNGAAAVTCLCQFAMIAIRCRDSRQLNGSSPRTAR